MSIPTEELKRSPPGWLMISPVAKEVGSYDAQHTLILPSLPKGYKSMPAWMGAKSRITAMDLRLQNKLALERYPDGGGEMSRVGPGVK